MAEGMDEAAQAFDAVISGTKAPKAAKGGESNARPTETLFRNGDRDPVDDDNPAAGGGDDISDEELLYGKSGDRSRARDAREKGGKAGEGRPPKDPDDDDLDADEPDESDEPEPDEEEESDDNESEEESAFLKQSVEVTVDGKPQEVTVKEALEGYIRTETFHRRMNQLDEAKKIVRKAASDAVQNYEYSMNLAKQMQSHMENMIPKEPNWDEEFAKDPAKARDLQRYYEKINGFKGQIDAQMREAAQRMQQSSHAQLEAFAEEEGQKFEDMNRKNWTDPKKKAKDLQSMRRTGLSAGFTEDELSQVYDSRMLQVLLKASKYDRMMAAKPKPVIRQQGKPIAPGAGSAKQRTARNGLDSAMKRLNRSGTTEDAAAVFDQIIQRG